MNKEAYQNFIKSSIIATIIIITYLLYQARLNIYYNNKYYNYYNYLDYIESNYQIKYPKLIKAFLKIVEVDKS